MFMLCKCINARYNVELTKCAECVNNKELWNINHEYRSCQSNQKHAEIKKIQKRIKNSQTTRMNTHKVKLINIKIRLKIKTFEITCDLLISVIIKKSMKMTKL